MACSTTRTAFEEPMKVNAVSLLSEANVALPQNILDETEALAQENQALHQALALLTLQNVAMQGGRDMAMKHAFLLQESMRCAPQQMPYYPTPVDPWPSLAGYHYPTLLADSEYQPCKKPLRKSKVWAFLKKGEHSRAVAVGSDSTKAGSESGSVDSDNSVRPPPGLEDQLPCTTMMMRNIPNQYNRNKLIDLFDGYGFKESIDLVYMPVDFNSQHGLGYAFVNLTNAEEADRFRDSFQGYRSWDILSEKICEVAASEVQGIEAHIERYRNSPVMHSSIPDRFKPALYRNGERLPFPAPTKNIRKPRLWSRPNP